MHRLDGLAEQSVGDKASRVERRVLEGADGGGSTLIRARRPGKTPARARQASGRRRRALVKMRVPVESERERQRRFSPSDRVIEDRRPVAGRSA